MKVLVIGATGMLGNAMLRVLSEEERWKVYGTIRSFDPGRFFPGSIAANVITGVSADNLDTITKAFAATKPDVVVNCVGLIKQLAEANDPLASLPINSMFPHRLAGLCRLIGARLVHISTDCVFSGEIGGYRETDVSDAQDLYGRSKFLGELEYPHTITLRTSFIGHELHSNRGLLDWFLSQQDRCRGFTKAIFSGLPTIVFARIVRDIIIPRGDLAGVYHVASKPIAKYDLLCLVAETYGKSIEIIPDDSLVIDRSLNADRFNNATGYIAPDWPELIAAMHSSR